VERALAAFGARLRRSLAARALWLNRASGPWISRLRRWHSEAGRDRQPQESRPTMALNFPNPVRSFDAGRSCVSFWGSDASLEITFQIEMDALRKLGSGIDDNQAQVLDVFDRNRDTILKAAANAYARNRASYHRLTPADF
jgi:hypothetical protein